LVSRWSKSVIDSSRDPWYK